MRRSPFKTISTDPRRRRMLAAGLMAASAAGGGFLILGRDRPSIPNLKLTTMRPSEAALWLALLPVILGSRLPEREPQRGHALKATVRELDRLLSGLPKWRRLELSDMSATLAAPLPRIMLAGSWYSWDRASGGDIRAFLHRWQHSPLTRLNLAYRTLVETAHLAWYAQTLNQQATGYPGPPERIRAYLRGARAT